MLNPSSLRLGLPLSTLLLPLLPLPVLALPEAAHSHPQVDRAAPLQIAQQPKTFTPRKDQPAPTSTVGAGRRKSEDVCPQERVLTAQARPLDQKLTPLSPPNTTIQYTLSPHPTLLVYVPKTSARSIELTVFTTQDRRERGIYQTTVALPTTPGIVRFTLPETVPPLEVGRDYKWMIAIACQTPHPLANDPFVESLIRRIAVEPALANQLGKTKGLQQVAAYGQAGLWYDMVAELAALRQAAPHDPQVLAQWHELLKSVGLEAIATAPLQN